VKLTNIAAARQAINISLQADSMPSEFTAVDAST